MPDQVFANRAIAELQQLSFLEADHLGRLSYPMILWAGKSHYERISWNERYEQEPR